jgi:uncharacterized membrane protein
MNVDLINFYRKRNKWIVPRFGGQIATLSWSVVLWLVVVVIFFVFMGLIFVCGEKYHANFGQTSMREPAVPYLVSKIKSAQKHKLVEL